MNLEEAKNCTKLVQEWLQISPMNSYKSTNPFLEMKESIEKETSFPIQTEPFQIKDLKVGQNTLQKTAVGQDSNSFLSPYLSSETYNFKSWTEDETSLPIVSNSQSLMNAEPDETKHCWVPQTYSDKISNYVKCLNNTKVSVREEMTIIEDISILIKASIKKDTFDFGKLIVSKQGVMTCISYLLEVVQECDKIILESEIPEVHQKLPKVNVEKNIFACLNILKSFDPSVSTGFSKTKEKFHFQSEKRMATINKMLPPTLEPQFEKRKPFEISESIKNRPRFPSPQMIRRETHDQDNCTHDLNAQDVFIPENKTEKPRFPSPLSSPNFQRRWPCFRKKKIFKPKKCFSVTEDKNSALQIPETPEMNKPTDEIAKTNFSGQNNVKPKNGIFCETFKLFNSGQAKSIEKHCLEDKTNNNKTDALVFQKDEDVTGSEEINKEDGFVDHRTNGVETLKGMKLYDIISNGFDATAKEATDQQENIYEEIIVCGKDLTSGPTNMIHPLFCEDQSDKTTDVIRTHMLAQYFIKTKSNKGNRIESRTPILI